MPVRGARYTVRACADNLIVVWHDLTDIRRSEHVLIESEKTAPVPMPVPSAVISGRDAQGYPFSARCRPTPDAASHTLRVMLPPEAPIEPGPAGLLCHSHDDLLWKQESFGLRGALQRADDGWRLEPLAIIPGISPDVLSLGRFFIDSRRKAKAYLAKRNLPRPTIPWDDIIAVKKQALSQ